MTRIYLSEGQYILLDPGPTAIPFLDAVQPGFKIESAPPGPDFSPKFRNLASEVVTLDRPLMELSQQELRFALFNEGFCPTKANGEYSYSRLEILHATALGEMSRCKLCGWECGTNRYSGERGKCGLGSQAFASAPFIHIAEERVINPAAVTNMAGCGLSCTYCTHYELWHPKNFPLIEAKHFWEDIQKLKMGATPINALEFTNPTESLPPIIGTLSQAPSDSRSPVVMNCHSYGSETFYDLAAPVTDVWLPDLRYGNDKCAKALSGVDNYMKYAKLGLDAMAQHDSKIIVRILVLPGHVLCCHEPAMQLLSEYRDRIWVSVLDQYVPEHEAHLDPNLKRRPAKEEIEAVNSSAEKHGLRNILESGSDFWMI